MRTLRMMSAAGVLLAAAGCGLGTTPMQHVVAECELEGNTGVRLGDDGHSLTVDTRGDEETRGASVQNLECALEALQVPDYVRERMATTRALDGRQSAQWNGLEGTWSYHPGTGMNLVVSPAE